MRCRLTFEVMMRNSFALALAVAVAGPTVMLQAHCPAVGVRFVVMPIFMHVELLVGATAAPHRSLQHMHCRQEAFAA